jgi:DNA helicase IV
MCLQRFRGFSRTTEETGCSELDRDINELLANFELRRIRKVTKIFLIGFLIGRNADDRIAQLTEKLENRITDEISAIKKLIQEIITAETYLIFTKRLDCLSRIETVQSEVQRIEKNNALAPDFINSTKRRLNEANKFVNCYNDKFVKKRKMDYDYLWAKGSVRLDDEQQTAIVTDDKYNLVVAAAGSGKTEVLITRIAYLIQRRPDRVDPSRILAIAYQRKAKEQIEQRLWQRYGIGEVFVRTFHKLGKDILEQSGKGIERTDIVDENRKYGFIKSYFEQNVSSNLEFYNLFIRYVKTVRDKDENPSEIDKKEVAAYAKDRKYCSINGTKVNSNAEKEIMDFLLTHKINGNKIEVKYEPDLDGFRPDFHLPQLDLFVEHWGIDREGNVPKWFSQSSEEYRESMNKKKKWFAENNRLLVETYSYEYNSKEPEIFGELLKDRIQSAVGKKILFTPLTYEEVLELVWASQKSPVDDIENFITTAKTYGFYPEDIAKKLESNKWSNKQIAFGRLALDVFRAYERQLKQYGKIDFEDMINEATFALTVDESLCRDKYDHILVDEYQDISAQRINLLKKLLERNPNCKLFCVGDDWQSIMGFSGSNLNYFVKFSTFFENPAITYIQTNYRSIKSIVEAGAELIKNNGDKQVKKTALTKDQTVKPIFVLGSPHQESYDKQYCRQTVEDCLTRIQGCLGNGCSPDDILVLTRFMRTRVFGRSKLFKIVETFSDVAKERGLRVSIDNSKLPNSIKLLTVHKCKGLEAKAVFILNVVSGEFGFPSEIEDPSILNLARGDNGIDDQIEEERRLFYVAITRAKEDLFIYTRLNTKSRFLEEIGTHSQPITMNY